jgi:hypothetical protein
MGSVWLSFAHVRIADGIAHSGRLPAGQVSGNILRHGLGSRPSYGIVSAEEKRRLDVTVTLLSGVPARLLVLFVSKRRSVSVLQAGTTRPVRCSKLSCPDTRRTCSDPRPA